MSMSILYSSSTLQSNTFAHHYHSLSLHSFCSSTFIVFTMSIRSLAVLALPLLSALVGASPHSLSHSSGHKHAKRCTYSAADRSCWGDYDLSTDYYTDGPTTGVTREVCLHPPCLSSRLTHIHSISSPSRMAPPRLMELKKKSSSSMGNFPDQLLRLTGVMKLVRC